MPRLKAKCQSCGGEADRETDYCYDCHRIICQKCVYAYGHFWYGMHELKPKSKRKKTWKIAS